MKQCGEQSLQNSSASNEKNQDDIDKIIFTIKQEDHSVEDNPLLSNGSEVEKQIEEKIDLVSHSDCAVLISGETGVGKERVAKRIHQLSGRKNGPWVAVNCAAIPAELFESEFFGYQKGAFTGAVRDHLGYFREAHGGTLFLDEIGELPLSQQCKLLRVIQEGEVRAVGSCNQQKIDVRIIAATNRNLAKEVEEEKFRRDLFYRINVIPIEIPPLRERRDDIAILAKAFIEKEIRSKALDSMAVSKAQWQNLLSYDWPGNIRQLGHEIERSILLGLKTKELTFFASSITGCGGSIAVNEDDVSSAEYSKLVQILNDSKDIDNKVFPLVETIKALEKILIVRALKKSSGRIYGSKGAADLLGVKGTTLASKIQKLDI
ncbi:MAG: sigma-54 interaction domain-containing protein [Pseudobdellovibrionaceae bacterium]